MRLSNSRTLSIVTAVVVLAFAQCPAAERLGDLLRDSPWAGLIGTWVDAETLGTKVKTTFAWKIPERVVEITSTEGGRDSVALVGVNGKTGEVFHTGADSQGTTFLGTWGLEGDEAVLRLTYAGGDGQEGTATVRLRLEDADSLTATVQEAQPTTLRLVRLKAKE